MTGTDNMAREAALESVCEAIKALVDAASRHNDPQFQNVCFKVIGDLCERLTTPLLRVGP